MKRQRYQIKHNIIVHLRIDLGEYPGVGLGWGMVNIHWKLQSQLMLWWWWGGVGCWQRRQDAGQDRHHTSAISLTQPHFTRTIPKKVSGICTPAVDSWATKVALGHGKKTWTKANFRAANPLMTLPSCITTSWSWMTGSQSQYWKHCTCKVYDVAR